MRNIKIILVGFVLGLSIVSTQIFAKEAMNVGNSVCPISGQDIGSMGEAYHVTYEGKEYNLCCKGCAPEFYKNSEKYVEANMDHGRHHEGDHH